MPRRLLRDCRIIDDDWWYAAEAPGDADAPLILPFGQWQGGRETWLADGRRRFGVLLGPADKVEALAPDLSRLALIAVEFSGPSEGRGYSQARMLREHWNFSGELRAVGYVRRDQLFLMGRCGFNSFELPDSDIEAAQAEFSVFSYAYQPSNDAGLPLRLQHRRPDITASAGSAGPPSGRR